MAGTEGVDEGLSRLPWWLFLLTGFGWLWFAFIVLSFDFRTVWAVAIFAGVSFLFAGVNELATASSVRDWRWLHAVLGVLSIGAGFVALVWPDITFVALAAVVGWFLLFQGTMDVVGSLMYRHDFWWLRLLMGAIEIAVAIWAIGYPGVSFVLLAAWVAAAALLRGIGQIILALAIRDMSRRGVGAGSGADTPSPGARRDGDGRGGNGSGSGGDGSTAPATDLEAGNRTVIDEFRRNHGRVGGDFAGQPLLLLHTRGAQTGQEQVSPLVYQTDGDRIVVFASTQGSPTNPDWYHDLLANPHATIELGDRDVDVDARPAAPDERDRWRTEPTIPVVVLEPSR